MQNGLSDGWRDWPHAPPHRLAEAGTYFVTARTTGGWPLFDPDSMKDFFAALLRELAVEFDWRLEAWCVLSNHYHLVAHCDGAATNLGRWLGKLHSLATKERNRRDGCPGRGRLWHNFRETWLTHETSYFARLHYVHANAVHHGLVAKAWQWKWSSAAEFERSVEPARAKTVYSFRYDRVAAADGE
ncbi:MAG: hypothetical protein JSR82_17955 [Verrucomicrobia bacterium]|nr:hypothetical protein [Verrucomicrobiota bacterium]